MPYFILQLHVVKLTLYMHFIFIFIRISTPIRENATNRAKRVRVYAPGTSTKREPLLPPASPTL